MEKRSRKTGSAILSLFLVIALTLSNIGAAGTTKVSAEDNFKSSVSGTDSRGTKITKTAYWTDENGNAVQYAHQAKKDADGNPIVKTEITVAGKDTEETKASANIVIVLDSSVSMCEDGAFHPNDTNAQETFKIRYAEPVQEYFVPTSGTYYKDNKGKTKYAPGTKVEKGDKVYTYEWSIYHYTYVEHTVGKTEWGGINWNNWLKTTSYTKVEKSIKATTGELFNELDQSSTYKGKELEYLNADGNWYPCGMRYGKDCMSFPDSRMYAAKKAVMAFVDNIKNNDNVNVKFAYLPFNDGIVNGSSVTRLTDDAASIKSKIEKTPTNYETKPEDALNRAAQILRGKENPIVIFISDGLPNDSSKALNAANSLKKTAIVYTIGYCVSTTNSAYAKEADAAKNFITSAATAGKAYFATTRDMSEETPITLDVSIDEVLKDIGAQVSLLGNAVIYDALADGFTYIDGSCDDAVYNAAKNEIAITIDTLKNKTVSFESSYTLPSADSFTDGENIETNKLLYNNADVSAYVNYKIGDRSYSAMAYGTPELAAVTTEYTVDYKKDGALVKRETGKCWPGERVSLTAVDYGFDASLTAERYAKEVKLGNTVLENTTEYFTSDVDSAKNNAEVNFTTNKYTVKFYDDSAMTKLLYTSADVNYGEDLAAADKAAADEKATQEAAVKAPEGKKCTFNGWYIINKLGIREKVTDDYFKGITKDFSVFADYTEENLSFTVTFMNGVSQVAQFAADYGTSLTDAQVGSVTGIGRPSNASENYTYGFLYWTTDSKAAADPTDTSCEKSEAWKNVKSNVTLYAVFEATPIPCTVTFVNVLGAGSNDEIFATDTVNKGACTSAPATEPVREADEINTYAFAYWSLEKAGEAFDFSTAITGDTTLYAVYTATQIPYVTVRFINADDTPVGSIRIVAGTVINYLPENPTLTKEGYTETFRYWSLEKNGEAFDILTVINEDTDLYAVYDEERIYHIVTFIDGKPYDPAAAGSQKITVAHGDFVNAAELTISPESGKVTIDEYNETVYTYTGWDAAWENMPVTADLTVNAVYVNSSLEYFDVSYIGEGNLLFKEKVVSGGSIGYSGNVPVKNEDAQYTYTFAGWSFTQNGEEKNIGLTDTIENVTENIVATAQFTPVGKTFTVTFKSEDGTTELYKALNVDYNGSATIPAEKLPTKAADAYNTYSLAGWTLTPAGTDFKTTDNTVSAVTTDITVYASFAATPVKYTVNFFTEGGALIETYTVNIGTDMTETAAAVAAAQTKPADEMHASFAFDKWLTEGKTDASALLSSTPAADLDVYASFIGTLRTFTVKFVDEDGVTDIIAPQTIEYGQPADKPATDPMKAASAQYIYTFAGWNGLDSAAVDAKIAAVTDDLTFIAKYDRETVKYTVTFMTEYTDGVSETIIGTSTVDYGTPASRPAAPAKPETSTHTYSFAGWSAFLADTGIIGIADTETMLNNVTDNFVVYAVYTAHEKTPEIPVLPPVIVADYTVSYKVNNESGKYVEYSVPAAATVVCGAYRAVAANITVPEGFIFSGWTTEDVTVANGYFTMPTNDVVFVGTITAEAEEVIELPEEPEVPAGDGEDPIAPEEPEEIEEPEVIELPEEPEVPAGDDDEVPKTGNESNMLIYFIGAAFALLGIVAYGRKKNVTE